MRWGNSRGCHGRLQSNSLHGNAQRVVGKGRRVRELRGCRILDAGQGGGAVGVALEIDNQGLPPTTPLCLGLHTQDAAGSDKPLRIVNDYNGVVICHGNDSTVQ